VGGGAHVYLYVEASRWTSQLPPDVGAKLRRSLTGPAKILEGFVSAAMMVTPGA